MKNNILIVDDSKPILCLLEAILGKYYSVTSVSDGLAAIDWLTGGNKPDLIISDVQMPLIDGWALARHVSSSALFKDIPIIILSGADSEEIKSKCDEFGINEYLLKPFDPIHLLEKVKNILLSVPLKKKPAQYNLFAY